MLSLRRPASAGFLERRRAAVDWEMWGRARPGEGSRSWLVETCRAELEWVEAEWRRLGGDPFAASRHHPHPAEALRLPHEQAAARLVNCHLHVDAAEAGLRDACRRLRVQRRAAADASQGTRYRADWTRIAGETTQDISVLRRQRAQAWRAFLDAAQRYRHLRRAAATLVARPSDALGRDAA